MKKIDSMIYQDRRDDRLDDLQDRRDDRLDELDDRRDDYYD